MKFKLLLLCLLSFTAKSQSLEADRAALVKFYNATNGPQWTNQSGWNTGSPCGWYGVACANGRVTQLSLINNNLSGTIPIERGELSELKILQLDVNHMSGTIPAEIATLTNLEILSFGINQLEGNIPPQLGKLTKLYGLSLSNNNLTGTIPDEIYNLVNLQSLSFGSNKLTGNLKNAIRNFSKLEYLYLYENQLSGPVPDSLGYLTNLNTIYLFTNKLEGAIPASLGNLQKLDQLHISDNELTGNIPTELGNLSSLTRFHFFGNNLTGPIPAALGNLSKLTELYLSDNQLTGSIPKELGKLKQLRLLVLNSNQLSGSMPAELENCSNLEYILLSNNHFSGMLPTYFGTFSKLRSIAISNNEFSGALPNFNNLPNDANLWIFANKFTFAGMEGNLSRLLYYSPQANIPFTINGKNFSVDAGGTLSNNTYRWFKNNSQIALNKGLNNLTMSGSGFYRVEVTNDLVPNLVLFSNTYSFDDALPVTLINFTAKKSDNKNLISWSTTSETDNAGFEIERSTDAKIFSVIGKVDGKGNSSITNSYHFYDQNPLANNYYRLKQIDYDGTSSYSRTVHLEADFAALKLYPNPAKGSFSLESADSNSPAILYNIQGQKVLERKGTNLHSFKTDNLLQGTYVIRVGEQSVKFLVEK